MIHHLKRRLLYECSGVLPAHRGSKFAIMKFISNFYAIEYTAWPKSCGPEVQAYSGLIINAMDLILPEMSLFRQSLKNFTTKIIFFVHFSFFLKLLTIWFF